MTAGEMAPENQYQRKIISAVSFLFSLARGEVMATALLLAQRRSRSKTSASVRKRKIISVR